MKPIKIVWLLLFLLLTVFMLVRTAWMCDDAYITLRTVENFVHGYGLTWNTAERVQAYTHPLWMFVLSFFFALTGDAYFMPITVSIILSLGAILLLSLKPVAKDTLPFILSATVLILSKSFVDYATSGLENPLSYVLAIAFIVVYFSSMDLRRKVLVSSLLASLLALNRLDLLLIFLPPLVYLYFSFARSEERGLRRLAKMIFLGFAPLLAWFAFSLIYYGFPFPNTYYAKIHTGVPIELLIDQGIHYFYASFIHDPITIFFIVVALLVAVVSRKADKIAVILGLLLFFAYIVRIGGDFMVGRFFAVPLVVSVALISATKLPKWCLGALIPAALLLGFVFPDPTLLSDENICFTGDGHRKGAKELLDQRGVCDERVHWYYHYGLLRSSDGIVRELKDRKIVPKRTDGKTNVHEIIIAGIRGYMLGPHYHLIDIHGLGDPLLARLPVLSLSWRIGHFRRKVPRGYWESIENGENLIVNPYLSEYYDKLKLITQGDMFSLERLAAIWGANTGAYDYLIEKYVTDATLNEVSHSVPPRADVYSPLTRVVTEKGLNISWKRIFHRSQIEIGLDRNDRYRLEYRRKGEVVASQSIGPTVGGKGIAIYTLDVPADAVAAGFNGLLILPIEGDGRYYVGQVKFIEGRSTTGVSPG